MNLSALRIFRAVVDEGGITRAAERLHRVQSNVTTRVRQLEDDLGVALFIRQGKRLHLAPAGQILYDYAERILNLSDEARAAVQDNRPRGPFRLGAMESTAAVRLPGPLAAYADQFPDVDLELSTGNPVQLGEAVMAGNIDAALVAEPIAEAKFDSVAAFDEEPVIVTIDDGVTLDGKAPKTAIVFEQGCPHRKRLDAWYAARGEAPERTIELGSYHAMLGCVLAGMGAALLPKCVLETFPEAKRLRVHALPENDYRLRTYLIWRKGVRAPNVAALAAILSENP